MQSRALLAQKYSLFPQKNWFQDCKKPIFNLLPEANIIALFYLGSHKVLKVTHNKASPCYHFPLRHGQCLNRTTDLLVR